MAKTDFFKAFNDSSKILEKNLKGIAVPLAMIMLLSIASGVAGFFFSQAIPFLPIAAIAGQAQQSTDGTGIGGIFWLLFAVLIILSIMVTWLTSALSLYIAQYFNAVMAKGKMPGNWAGVIAGNLFKTLVMFIIVGAIFAVIFGIPAALIYAVSSQFSKVMLLAAGAVMFLAALLLFAVASFFLSPLWIYYAVDRNGIFQSIGKSISLVRGSLSSFFLLYVVFVAISFGAAMFSTVLCCFSFFISPIIMALVTALYQITMMRLKLDSEAPQGRKQPSGS